MSYDTSPDRPRVLAIALNPALDHTIEVERLTLGEVNRGLGMQAEVGGKGFNVASCLADFGIPTAVTGLLGQDNATPFEALFRGKGIQDHCLRLPGLTRVNTKLVDRSTGHTTDINLPGPVLTPQARQELLAALLAKIDGLIATGTWVVLAGSLPPDWPDETYHLLARHIHQAGGRVALDASGAALAAGLTAGPDMVKPNRVELAELAGGPLDAMPALLAAGRRLMAGPHGPASLDVSMGGDGALFLDRGQALLARPLKVDLISTVGAGDAMVAGMIAAQLEGLPLPDCARLATAFAVAKLSRLGPHLPAPEQVRALAATVELAELA